jgi:hypothetical protein
VSFQNFSSSPASYSYEYYVRARIGTIFSYGSTKIIRPFNDVCQLNSTALQCFVEATSPPKLTAPNGAVNLGSTPLLHVTSTDRSQDFLSKRNISGAPFKAKATCSCLPECSSAETVRTDQPARTGRPACLLRPDL